MTNYFELRRSDLTENSAPFLHRLGDHRKCIQALCKQWGWDLRDDGPIWEQMMHDYPGYYRLYPDPEKEAQDEHSNKDSSV